MKFPTLSMPNSRIALTLAAIAALVSSQSASAASASWIRDLSSSWTTAANWDPGVPGSTTTDNTDIATFSMALTAARAVTVDANRYIGGISFVNTSTFGYTVQTGTLHLNNGGVIQTLAGDGNHQDVVSAPIIIDGDGGSAFFTANATSATSILQISGTVSGVSTGTNVTILNLNGSGISVGSANATSNVVSGVISDGAGGGKLAVVKSDAGTWYLSNAGNTYSGGTLIKGGTLVAKSTVFGSGAVTLGDTAGTNSATLLGANGTTFSNAIVLAANASSGPLTIGNAYFGTGGTVTFTGGVTGANNLVLATNMAGSGFSFTTAAVDNAGTITNTGTATGAIPVSIETTGSNVTGIIQSSATQTFTVTNLTPRGAGLATALVNTGSKALTITNVGTGAGNLVLNNNGASNNVIVLTNGANNTGSITNSGTGTGGITFLSSQVIGSNVTGVTQNSTTSSLTLAAVNTYTGSTTISAGTLILASTGSIANSSGVNLGTAGSHGTLDLTSKASGYTFGSAQTLSGYGNITMAAAKTLTVNGGITPGTNGTGVVTLTVGNLSLTSTATVTMDLVDNTLAAGSGFDQISLAGSLTYGGVLDLNVGGLAQLGVYHLFTGFLSESGTFSSINFSSGATGSFNYATGDLTLTGVPEPQTWALAGVGLGLALLRLRTRSRRSA